MVERKLIVSNLECKDDENTFFLNPQLWFLLGSTAISICGISLRDSVVSKSQAESMASALEGADIEWFTRLFSGMEKSTLELVVSSKWFNSTEGRAKVKGLIAFLRQGDFKIVSEETV
jgi:hypothetical protein